MRKIFQFKDFSIFIGLGFFLMPTISAWAAIGKPFNPDLSVNFLGLTQQGNQLSNDRSVDSHNGTQLQEAELQIFSDVDPYFKANVLLSISPKGTEYGIDPEEVFVESTFLPSVTLKAGKFKAALGKHNTLHTHAFPFIDAPLINQLLLGSEGLNEAGLSAAAMLPTSWFSELTGQVLSNNNDVLYNSSRSGDYSEVAQFKNLWDLSEEATLEFTVFGTQGANQFAHTSVAYGNDVIVKWRPSVGGKYQALWWGSEYLAGNRNGADTIRNLGGMASWLQYQFSERWWIQGRYEFVGLSHSSDFVPENKQSMLLGLYPSEFSGLRLQLDHLARSGASAAYTLAFQYNITIGAHPAHSY